MENTDRNVNAPPGQDEVWELIKEHASTDKAVKAHIKEVEMTVPARPKN